MAIDGRINVDVLFHDTDGTASLKVVSLEDTTAYTTGKVAIVTGTCGTAAVAITDGLSYKDAAGNVVTFNSPIRRAAFSANPAANIVGTGASAGAGSASRNNQAAVVETLVQNAYSLASGFSVSTTAGTASFTLVLYGT
jgi:hypothetical protein